MELTKEKLEELILECKSKSDVCKKLNISPNGAGYKKIDTLFENFGIKFEFKKSKNHFVKYETVTKKCPVCENEFETKKGSKKEKMTLLLTHFLTLITNLTTEIKNELEKVSLSNLINSTLGK